MQPNYFDTYYIVKRLNPYSFDITVFSGATEPDNQYRVEYTGYSINCDCPGFHWDPTKNHKHIKIVEKFIELNEPSFAIFWLDKTKEVHYKIHFNTLKEIAKSLTSWPKPRYR